MLNVFCLKLYFLIDYLPVSVSLCEFHSILCGSNAFQDYFDDAKDSSLESRVKQVPRIKESFNQSKFQESKSHSIKIQDSSKESREDSIKISIKRVS